MASKPKGYLTIALKIAVAAALIAYMVHSGHLDLTMLWGLMTPLNVALALSLIGVNIVLCAWRWILLLKARGFEVPFGYGITLYLIGIFFNHALPGAVGGDLVRGYYLVADHPERKVDSVLAILIDRVLGLYSFFLLTLVAVAFDYSFILGHEQIRWVAILCFLIFLGMTVFFTVVFSERLTKLFGLKALSDRITILSRMIEAVHRFGKDRKIIALSVIVSLLAQVFTMFFFYQLGIVSGEIDITWKAVLFAVPMGFVVTALPISPAGIGVGQVAFHYLFQIYLNKDTPFGTTAITAYQLGVASWALAGAILYLRRKRPKELQNISAAMEMSAP